ncbi:hypothetical protein F5Y14DRAFT_460930 [Nemania sp. NC0429]|nr:hypothetical protein F5Y14DRAFT_460930 [Nemania sp. NC0429]
MDETQSLETGHSGSVEGRAGKRAEENTRDPAPQPPPKRLRQSLEDTPVDKGDPYYPIELWAREGSWPREYLEEPSIIELTLVRKPPLAPIRRVQSWSDSATSATPSDRRPREEKSAPYEDTGYETLLASHGSFMAESLEGVTDSTKAAVRSMLEKPQPLPEYSIFDDSTFKAACRNLQGRNEARVIQDISWLIVPSAEILAVGGAKHLKILAESVNAGWNNSIPLTGIIRPQPDYSVGFSREAFTEGQLANLSPFIGDFLGDDLSLFMATYYMYFPFLASEVKCGATSLDVADRQNAHSMTLAVRGVVALFRIVNREEEVNRQILAWSISHDHRSVRIYGYYPVIDDEGSIQYYRHPIRAYDFTELDGKEKWTAYRFTRNIYDTWMPDHFKRICSVINQLPSNMDIDVPVPSESTSTP